MAREESTTAPFAAAVAQLFPLPYRNFMEDHQSNSSNKQCIASPATPKIHNIKKRRSSGMSSSSGNIIISSSNSSNNSDYYCCGIIDDANTTTTTTTTATTTSTSTTFDCQSLQRSLKRVRLSTSTSLSPGELRLKRDLRHAVINHRWIPGSNDHTNNNEWTIPYHPYHHHHAHHATPRSDDTYYSGRSYSGEAFKMHDETTPGVAVCQQQQPHQPQPHQQQQQWSPNTNDPVGDSSSSSSSIPTRSSSIIVTVTQDEQDPMELVVSMADRATLHLQFPRMYPHVPPVVRRIVDHHHQHQYPQQQAAVGNHHFTPSNERGNNDSNAHIRHHEIPTTTSNKMAQQQQPLFQKQQQLPQRIIIAASPDSVLAAKQQLFGATPPSLSSVLRAGDAAAATIVLTEWTPVSRLTDIVDWLVQAVFGMQTLTMTTFTHQQPGEPPPPTTTTASQSSAVSLLAKLDGEDCFARGDKRGNDDDDDASCCADEKKDDDRGGSRDWRPPPTCCDSSDRATERNAGVFSAGGVSHFSSNAASAGQLLRDCSHHHPHGDRLLFHQGLSEEAELLDSGNRSVADDVDESASSFLFPPNRFDVGYERRATAVLQEFVPGQQQQHHHLDGFEEQEHNQDDSMDFSYNDD